MTNLILFLYVLNKQLLVHYVHSYFKTKTHFCCCWCCPHNIVSLYFSNSIANDFANRFNTIIYKKSLLTDLSYEIILSIIMIKNYVSFASSTLKYLSLKIYKQS